MPIEAEFQRLMAAASVPGIAAAIVLGERVDQFSCHGVCGVPSPDPVDENTVFEAASLTKPVFAHTVLQLADLGHLSLDAPLGSYLPDYLGDDQASSITFRQVLCHCAGLPNWRSADLPLKTYFPPGERFSYSGEGFLYMQKVVEAITGEKAHTLVERLVLQPFGMTRSSLIWDFRLNVNRAYPHDAFGRPALNYKPGEANAAWSMQTTAADFARFLIAVLSGTRLSPDSARAWLQPQIEIRHPGPQSLGPKSDVVATGVAWGLGWGLEPDRGTFFHWGDNGPFTAYTIGSLGERAAMVVFANGASGLSIMPEIVAHFWPGDRPSFAWLNYRRYDSPVCTLLRAARAHGIRAIWHEARAGDFGLDDLQWVAQGLSAAGQEDDCRWLRARIEERATAIRAGTK